MNSLAVWMTSDEAKIFLFSPTGVETKHLTRHGKSHHKEVQGKNHSQKGGDADHFFHEVAKELSTLKAGRWLVLGPGLAKTHFDAHVKQHHPQDAVKICAVEAMDHATNGEITNFAHDYFKRHGQFEAL